MSAICLNDRAVSRITIGLIFFILINVGLLNGQEPPVVGISFLIPDTVFTEIDPEVQDAIISEINNHIVEKCSTYFGFLSWKSVSTSTSLSSDQLLLLNLKTINNSIGLQAYDLVYSGKIGNDYYPNFQQIRPYRLYEYYDEKPIHNPQKLKEDIIKGIETQFFDEAFRRDLHNNFLKEIPLTQKVYPDSSSQRIILPILWSELNSTQRSILLVEFKANGRDGYMEVNPVGQVYTGQWDGMVKCVVIHFSHDPIEDNHWNDEIIRRLQKPQLDTVDVFMSVYDKKNNPGTFGTTVIDPD